MSEEDVGRGFVLICSSYPKGPGLELTLNQQVRYSYPPSPPPGRQVLMRRGLVGPPCLLSVRLADW